MNSPRRALTVALIAALALSSGCTWFAPKPPKEAKDMVQTALTNFFAQPSHDHNGTLELNMLGKDTTGKAQNVTLRVSLSGSENKPFQGGTGFTENIGVNAKVDQDTYATNLEIRNKESNFFVNIANLTGPESQIPKDQVSALLAKWWKIPLPGDLYAKLADQGAQSYMSQIQNNWLAASSYLKSLDYDGTDTVNGLKSYHYTGEVDVGKLQAFFEGFFKSQGAEMTSTDLKSLQEIFASSKATIDFWISMDTLVLDRVKVVARIDKITGDDGKTAGKADATFDLSYSNFGKPVVIEEPVGSTEFNLFGMFGDGEEIPPEDSVSDPVKTPVKTPAKK